MARLLPDGSVSIELNPSAMTEAIADLNVDEEIWHYFATRVLVERWRGETAAGRFDGDAQEFIGEVMPEMLHDLRSRIGAIADASERAAMEAGVVGSFNTYFGRLAEGNAPLAASMDDVLRRIAAGTPLEGTDYVASVWGFVMELDRQMEQMRAKGLVTEQTHEVYRLGQIGQWVRAAFAAIQALAAKLLEMGHPLHASELSKLARETRARMEAGFARGGTDVEGEALHTVRAGGETVPTGGAWASKNPRGREVVRGTWALMPLRLLGINKQFGTDQDRINREKTGAAQRAEIVGNMTEENIPLAWGNSATLNDGSPIITPDGSVVVGNNRTMALRDVYGAVANAGRARAYEAWARAEAGRLGLDGQAYASEPVVLVRVAGDTAGLERGELVKAANKAGVDAKSEADVALEHSALLDNGSLMAVLNPGEDGGLNREFLQAFARVLPDRGMVRDSAGNLDLAKTEKAAHHAMLAALLRGAKNFEQVLSALITASGREGMKRTLAGVFRALPALLKIQRLNPSAGILTELGRALAALPDYRTALADGLVRNVEEYLAQGDLLESPLDGKLLRYLAEGHSAAEIAEQLGNYVRQVEALGDPAQEQMFAGPAVEKGTLGGALMAKLEYLEPQTRNRTRDVPWYETMTPGPEAEGDLNRLMRARLYAPEEEGRLWAEMGTPRARRLAALAKKGKLSVSEEWEKAALERPTSNVQRPTSKGRKEAAGELREAIGEGMRQLALFAKVQEAPSAENRDRQLDYTALGIPSVEQPPEYRAPDLKGLRGPAYHQAIADAVQAHREALGDWLDTHPDTPLVFAPRDPMRERVGFVSRTPSTGKWRLTHFQFQRPTGHIDYGSKVEALEDAIRYYRRLDPGAMFAKNEEKAVPMMGAEVPPQNKPVTLVYRGTFNPPHVGHRMAVELGADGLRRLGYQVANVVVAPSPESKVKAKLGAKAYSLGARTALTQATMEELPGVNVTGEPAERNDEEGASWRSYLGQWAAQKYPGTTPVLVIGADRAPGEPPGPYALYSAPAAEGDGPSYFLVVPRVPGAASDVSSSKIRAALEAGLPVPPGSMTEGAERQLMHRMATRDLSQDDASTERAREAEDRMAREAEATLAPEMVEAIKRGEPVSFPNLPGAKHTPGLSRNQRLIEAAFYKQISDNPQEALRKYFELAVAETATKKDGLVVTAGVPFYINTDLAREVFKSYEPKATRNVLERATVEPAGYIANTLAWDYWLRVGPSAVRPDALFVSGAMASGKTTATKTALPGDRAAASLIVDTPMSSYERAEGIVAVALEKGWCVNLVHVFRSFDKAVSGALDRIGSEGRAVPLGMLEKAHYHSQQVFLQLAERFGGNPMFRATVVMNDGDFADIRKASVDELREFLYAYGDEKRRASQGRSEAAPDTGSGSSNLGFASGRERDVNLPESGASEKGSAVGGLRGEHGAGGEVARGGARERGQALRRRLGLEGLATSEERIARMREIYARLLGERLLAGTMTQADYRSAYYGTAAAPRAYSGVFSKRHEAAGQGDLFDLLPVKAAAAAYVGSLPVKKPAAVRKAAIEDGLGAQAELLFDFAAANPPEAVTAEVTPVTPEVTADVDEAVVDGKAAKSARLSTELLKILTGRSQHKKLDWQKLFELGNKYFEGTQAGGTYTVKDAYDALEVAVNRWIGQHGSTGSGVNFNTAYMPGYDAREQLGHLRRLVESLPTQTKRTAETDEFQQFSTVPTLGFVAAWVAKLSRNDVMLEPSAGVGGLAVFGRLAGAKVVVNELSARRRALLEGERFDHVMGENAEYIDSLLPARIRPNVVVMNPPFSATAGRMQGSRDTSNAIKHIEGALRTLPPGGRLVAIVGTGMGFENAGFNAWWRKMRGKYDVRANIEVNGAEYAKYGTTFDNRLLVIDVPKDEGSRLPAQPVTGRVEKIEALIPLLEDIRNERQDSTGTLDGERGGVSSGPAGKPLSAKPGGNAAGADAAGGPGGIAGAQQPGMAGAGEQGGGGAGGGGSAAGMDSGRGPGGGKAGGVSGRGEAAGQPANEPVAGAHESGFIEARDSQASEDAIFDTYQPRITYPGTSMPPVEVQESAAMAAIDPIRPTYQPALGPEYYQPQLGAKEGRLSALAMESITLAGHAHQEMIPAGLTDDEKREYLRVNGHEAPAEFRKGFFIGDGTGMGKGRQVSGIILDNWLQGRTRAVWVSEKPGLVKDAKRDMGDVHPGMESKIFPVGDVKATEPIGRREGVAFLSYAVLRSQAKAKEGEKPQSRLDQLVNWLGADFDGVIAFDEAQAGANAVEQPGKRGVKEASQQAAAMLALQRRLPRARVVYVSATGATEVSNLGYAERLGLWGPGTPFGNIRAFIAQVASKGTAAMELVAQNLKALGLYVSRAISWRGIEYRKLVVRLTPEQRELYDKMAEGWQVALRNIDQALIATGAVEINPETGQAQTMNPQAKSNAYGAFWGAHQRFFNQIITSLKTPEVIRDMDRELAAGNAVVVQLTNTNEASQKRAVDKLKSAAAESGEKLDLDDLDMTPRDILLQMVQNSFPVGQQETYTDQDGNERVRTAVDSAGNPVVNQEAVAMREQLLNELASLRVPDGPLEMLLNHFGAEHVAEITGRTQRVVWGRDKQGSRVKVIERRGTAARDVDAQAFDDDKKRVLVFSNAGGTGSSYHADRKVKNQRPRKHYLLQPGWQATRAVQGLGRTNRNNQRQQPEYILAQTEIEGEKRFISSIARRLDQLGALTKGQRETGGQGMFKAGDNLESPEATAALRGFLEGVMRGGVPDVSEELLVREMGLKLRDKDGQPLQELPDITKFLNRVLSLSLGAQTRVFNAFSGYLDRIIEQKTADGTLDTGVEVIKALSASPIEDRVIHTDPRSGSMARYVRLDLEQTNEKRDFPEGADGWFVNVRSGRVYAHTGTRSATDTETGRVFDEARMVSVTGTSYQPAARLGDAKAWRAVGETEARDLWAALHEATPGTRHETEHFLTGTLLPVWDRFANEIPVRLQKVRLKDGRTLIGLTVPGGHLETILTNFGQNTDKTALSAKDVAEGILSGGKARLGNGWSMKRARVAGEDRIELIGPSYTDKAELDAAGVFSERIQWAYRNFIPVDRAEEVIGKLTATRPVVEMTGGRQDGAMLSKANEPAAVGRLVLGNLGLAVSIARDYANVQAPMEDIVAEARKALVQAAWGFNPAKGRFSDYAGRAIRNALNSLFGREGEYARRMETTLDAPVSAERGMRNAESQTGKDLVTREGAESVTGPIEARETREALASVIARMPEYPRAVLQGLAEGRSLADIAAERGVSRQAVGKVADNARKAAAAMLKRQGFTGVTEEGAVYAKQQEAAIDDAVARARKELNARRAARQKDEGISISEDEHRVEEDGRLWFTHWSAPAGDEWMGQFVEQPTIMEAGGEFYVGEGAQGFKSLDAAFAAARETIKESVKQQGGTFGSDMDGQTAANDIIAKFPSAIPGVEQGGWFHTKWGSWYLEGHWLDENGERDYDRSSFKLSLRDHDVSRTDMGRVDKSFQVSKQWEPEEVGEALKKALRWITKKATAAPLAESGGAGFKTAPEARVEGEPGAPARAEDVRLADRATEATSLPVQGETTSGAGGVNPEKMAEGKSQRAKKEGRSVFSKADEARPYGKVPRTLMGFPKEGPTKGFDEQRYPFTQTVRATWPDGLSHVDQVKGMNKAHAMERARINWPGAAITEATQAEFDATEPFGVYAKLDEAAIDFERDAILAPVEPVKEAHPHGALGWLHDMYAKLLKGRKDVLEHFAPGTKNVIETGEMDAARVRAGMREMMEKMKGEVDRVMGRTRDEAGKLRRAQFAAELLPTAARLNATGYDGDQNLVFTEFEMRAGQLPKKLVEKAGLGTGSLWTGKNGEVLRIGEYLEDLKAWQLLRPMSVERQEEAYRRFSERYPEGAHHLDRWIAPGLGKARVTDARGVVLPEFNRHALREFFGEVSPHGELYDVAGYVPEIQRTRTLAGAIAGAVQNLLNKNFKSGARDYKSGAAREEGNVKSLWEGFAIRAMEAHAEAQRLALAEKLLPMALKDIPEDGLPGSGWMAVNEHALPRLADAYAGAMGMTKEQLLRLTVAVQAGDEAALKKIVGQAWAELRGRKMIRKEIFSELVRPLADKQVRNGVARVMDSLSKSYTAGLLAHSFSWIQNQFSNELFKMMRAAQRTLYAAAVRPVNRRESRIAIREAWELVKGMVANRWWSQARINEIVVPEYFEGNTSISGAARSLTEERMTAADWLKQGNVPQALLTAARYQNMDVRTKQQLAYASYIAQAGVAADEAVEDGFVFRTGAQRVAWMKDWLAKAPESVHRRAYHVAVAYAMDYSNVPFWADPDARVMAGATDITAGVNIIRRLTMAFIKWPYNMARQMKRFGGDSALDALAFAAGRTLGHVPGIAHTEMGGTLRGWAGKRGVAHWNPRLANSVAHLGTYAMMLAVLRAMVSGNPDDDELEKLGRSFDMAGKRLDRQLDTSSRINISDVPVLGPAVRALGKMHGDEEGENDYWLRVRTIPYASPMMALAAGMSALGADAKDAKGAREEAGMAFREFVADLLSEGVLLTVANKIRGNESKYTAGQTLSTYLGGTLVDVGASRVAPVPLLGMARDLVTPRFRRLTPNEGLEYDPGVIEGMQARIPGLNAKLPPGGRVQNSSLEHALGPISELEARGEPNAYRVRMAGDGKARATYVRPETLADIPRWRTLLRLAGLNVKPVNRAEYEMAVHGELADWRKLVRKGGG